MEITQQVRDYAATLNETPEMAAEHGMAEMSGKFREMGEKLYIDATSQNDASDGDMAQKSGNFYHTGGMLKPREGAAE